MRFQILFAFVLPLLFAVASATSIADKFDGAFLLVNLTSPVNPATSLQWSFNPRGQISYFRHLGRMSAVLNHDPLDNNNPIAASAATPAQLLATGTGYAGSFTINEVGAYVTHFPETTTNPVAIPELMGDPTAIAEPRCYRWFDNDNLLQLFVPIPTPGQPFSCSGTIAVSLFWRRLPRLPEKSCFQNRKKRAVVPHGSQ